MIVGLDLLFLLPGESGGRETYSRELATALAETRPDIRLTTFVNAETAAAGPGFWTEYAERAIVLPRTSARSRAAWAVGELVGLTRAASRAGVDVLHAPANFGPVSGPFARVLTLHDVLFRLQADLVAPAVRWATGAMIVPAIRRADRVITGSAAARTDIAATLGVAPERIDVVPHGFTPPSAAPDLEAAREHLRASGRPVALAVATHLPHKNLGVLLDALALLEPAHRPLLVFAGHGTDSGELAARAEQLGVSGDARFLGPVSAELLEGLYAAAALLATTTLNEGFGLPVLEAMARGVPVAASDLAVLREVAGDAAVWHDPRDPSSVAAALRRLLAGGPEVERLRAAGRDRAQRFSWRATAEATARVYDRALGARAPRRPVRASA